MFWVTFLTLLRKEVTNLNDQNSTMDELVAALNDHQVTGDEGQIREEVETSQEEPTASEVKTTVTETASAEKPEETKSEAPQAEEEDSETQLAEDETGKRYVPEKRFKGVYGKLKEAERRLQELEAEKLLPNKGQSPQPQANPIPLDRTAALETELLKGKLPQFDPESDQYDPTLDELGGQILAANPGITKIEAARRALKYTEKLATKVAEVKAEARLVKSIQADQGITSRVMSRTSTEVDPTTLSLEQKEEWLKAHGQW